VQINGINEDWYGPQPQNHEIDTLNDIHRALNHVTAESLKAEYDRIGGGPRGKGAGESFRALVESTLRWRSWLEDQPYFETEESEFRSLKFEWASPREESKFDAAQWCHGHSSGILEKVSKPLIIRSFPELRANEPSHVFLLVGTRSHNNQLGINNAAATDEKVRFFLKAMERYLLVPTKLITYGEIQGFELEVRRGLPKRFVAKAN